METPNKMDDLGVPLFLETPICLIWNGSNKTFHFFPPPEHHVFLLMESLGVSKDEVIFH